VPRRQVFLPLLVVAAVTGCSAPSSENAAPVPTNAPGELPEEPTLPGAETLETITVPGNDEYLRLRQVVSEVEALNGSELLSRYPTSSEPLGYDPSEAEFLDRIQASALGLDAGELTALSTNGFVISTRQAFPTMLRGYAAIYSEDLPVYVSADALLDSVHRAYDKMLASIERTVLIGDLDRLLSQMLQALPSVEASEATKADTETYLLVALSLLRQEAGTGAAADFVSSAMAAGGIETVEFFGGPRMLDFSQFTPRGHYTESEEMMAYFRAMMWLGRIDLRLIETLSDGTQVFHRSQYESTLVLHELLRTADNLALWEGIDSVIRTFVGESDYMVVPEVELLVSDLGGLQSAWGATDAAVAQAIAQGRYGEQQIMSHLMVNDGTVKTLPLNRSFLVFGQRYIVDSHVFSEVVYDRVEERWMPTPLDAAFAALGNNQAAALNSAELVGNVEYARALGKMRVLIDEHDDEFWSKNFYNLWVSSLRALSPAPDAEGMPAITKTEGWGLRMLNTQLGSWAQLRHDTLLYAKQSYTGIPACEFPDAYVDPYPEFFAALRVYAEKGAELLPGLARDEALAALIASYFDNLLTASTILGEMAEQQRSGVAPTAEQLAFINEAVRVEQQAVGCTTVEVPDGWYARLFLYPEESIEQDLTIADVHTQPADATGNIVGHVLHVGTSFPRLMVTTVDTCLGPRAYAGVVYSYHERVTTDFERLTDERWTQDVQASPPADVPWLGSVLAP
jgi:hypothetical protein